MKKFYASSLNRKGLSSIIDFCASSPPRWQRSTSTHFGMVILLFMLLLSSGFGFAQSSANYVFATNATSSLGLDANGNVIDLSSGATALVGATSDQGVSPVTPIGFNFMFFGNNFSQFSVSANGILQLGPNSVSGSTYVASGGTTSGPKFSPMGSDGQTASVANGGGVISKIVGTAPNRSLVVQWVTHLWYQNTTNPATFQIRLYESTGVVEYVYGSMNTGTAISSSYSVGFSAGTVANQFASITTSTNTVSTTVFNTNTYTTNTNIANLHSTEEGSRRSYSFTPPSTVSGDVNDLTFSAIAANGVTLNWNDNATNEVGFVVTRATDAAFTQNVASFSVASTTSATTGTAYSLVQTGIGAGTVFYYKVIAIVEAGQSTGVMGNVSTLTGATYYWTGITGENWNTFSNWNTAADGSGTVPTVWDNSDVYIIDGAGTTSGGALSIVVDRPSFNVGQVRIVSNTDLTLASSAAATRTITILGGPGDDFVLEAGSTLNLTSATNAVAFAFSGSGNSGLLAGTYVASGSTSNVITTTGGTGTLMVVASTGSVTSSLNSSSAALVGSIPSLRFDNGSNYNHAASTTVNYIPTATWQPTATATLSGNTTGTSMTSGSTTLGNLVVNTTLSTATFSAFTSTSRIIQGNLTVNSTGTGRFRAITSGVLQINGNLIINGGIFEVGSSTGGGVIVKGNTTVALGAILDLNQSVLQNEGNVVNNGSILSSETTTANSSLNFLGTATAQTLSGTGTFTGRVSSLGVSNPMGLTISTPVLTQRVNLFSGTIIGSSNITMGTGLALAGAVQIGSATNTTSGGNFDVSPVFNLGTGTYSLLYLGETTPRTTGFEVPASRSVNNLTVNNANGLTIAGGTIEVVNGLTLTNGVVTSSLANHIIHGSATAAGTLTGGSATSYINGPIVRTINNANTAFVLFPVGKLQYAPVSLAPTTTEVSRMRAETFDTNAGTATPSIINLSAARRWETALISGAFTDVKVRVADAMLVSTNIPVQAPSAAGAYSSTFGSTAIFTAGTPNVLESSAAVTAANFTGFLSFADSNACTGTPAPGNTIASSNAICFGSSVTLSLENMPSGSGITYQWKSSSDGVTFTDIANETNATLTVTPAAATFYLAAVTCASSAVTGNSTAVQITFANTIASTTPATRCGQGTVTLAATGNVGANINWFANVTGGAPIATGTSFETPIINATTTYYASAASVTAGNVTIGTGTALTSSSSQNSVFCNYWATGWRQMVYTAAELSAAGLSAGSITSLTFNIATLPDPGTVNNFAIRLGTSANTTLSTFTTTGLANAFGPVNYTPVLGLNTIVLSTPYLWDGTSNILIDIREDGQYANANSQTFVTTTATNTVVHGFSSGTTANPAYYTSNPTATASNTRPNVIFNGQVACSSARVPVIATVTTPPALTLSALVATICEGDSTSEITVTAGAVDYDTFSWSPTTGVTGNATTGWVFNPSTSTVYTLTVSQSAGTLCATTVTFGVTVNPIPSVVTITPSSATVCQNGIQTLTTSGGILGISGKIGTGTAGNTLSTPFKNNWGGSKSQALYTAAELTALGMVAGQKINSIGYVTLSNSTTVLNGFTINAGFVTASSLGTAFIAGATSSATVPANFAASTTGNINFALAVPLLWDGVSNLLIENCFNNNNSGIGLSVSVESTTVASGLNIYLSQDNNATVCTNTTAPSTTTTRPNLRISTLETATTTWSPITNLFTDAAATIPYAADANATTVYFKSAAVGVTTYNATATTTFGCFRTASTAVTTVDCGIPYANLQFPGTATIGTCVSPTYYAQVYKEGVTEAAGQGAGITAWIGRNNENTDPSTWTEASWQLATFNVQAGNNDEYQVTFAPSAEGTYYVASRFVFVPGQFVYGGYTATGGGIWDGITNVSGVLTVQTTAAPTASAQTFCTSGTVADLVATGTGLQWYDVVTGGTALTSTTALASGDYYVSQTLNSCESVRTMVAVTVNVTAAPTASAQTFCTSGTVADLVATGTDLQWYAAATGGMALISTTALASGDYYVSQTLNSCESARTMVAVTVNVTAAPTASAQTFCTSGTVADLVATGTDLQWYAAATGGMALISTTALASGDYYVSQTLNSCESVRTMVAVTVNVIAAPTASAQTFCTAGTVADLVASGTGLQWYAAANGGTALVNTAALASGDYYVSQTLNSCESARTMVAVTVNVTDAPTGAATQDFTTGQTLASFTVVGQNIIWYSAATGTTVLPTTTVLISGTVYYASQTVNGCESTTRLAVTAGVDLRTPEFDISSLRYYPNPVQNILNVEHADGIQTLQIYNMVGQLVYNKTINSSKVTIEMSGLVAGNYIMQVTVKGITKNVKVIKK